MCTCYPVDGTSGGLITCIQVSDHHEDTRRLHEELPSNRPARIMYLLNWLRPHVCFKKGLYRLGDAMRFRLSLHRYYHLEEESIHDATASDTSSSDP